MHSCHSNRQEHFITNVQIVNGLQTSECIFRYFSENGNKEDDRAVLIKILPCDSSVIADDITRSTNNQTEVQSASLRATDKIQEDIEDILKKEGLYYERRINYYLNQGVPIERIFSPLYLAAGYMALVLKRPYKAVALKQKFMRKKESYEEIFSEKDNVMIWPVIAKIMRKTDEYMNVLRQNGSGDRFMRNVRYQVSFLTISRLLDAFAYMIRPHCKGAFRKKSKIRICFSWAGERSADWIRYDIDKCWKSFYN